MAFSNYSYWDPFHQFNAETTIFAQTETSHEQLSSELQGCSDYLDFADYVYSCNSTDHLFNQHNMMFCSSENYDYLHPDHFQEVLPKRQKLAAYGFQDYSQEVPMLPLPEYPPMAPPPVYRSCVTCDGGSHVKRQQPTSGGSLSAQSIAARQRRRKITDKTQQLGKLIPGGQKMNTAEMFGAAHKYIKFLQAQVGILEFVTKSYDHQENKEPSSPKEEEHYLHGLLESPLIQERLSSLEKCLVPKTLVQSLNRDDQS